MLIYINAAATTINGEKQKLYIKKLKKDSLDLIIYDLY